MTAHDATFGRYEVLGVLGRGGFSTVHRGWDPALQREVALKVLPHFATEPDVCHRSWRLACAAQGLFGLAIAWAC